MDYIPLKILLSDCILYYFLTVIIKKLMNTLKYWVQTHISYQYEAWSPIRKNNQDLKLPEINQI